MRQIYLIATVIAAGASSVHAAPYIFERIGGAIDNVLQVPVELVRATGNQVTQSLQPYRDAYRNYIYPQNPYLPGYQYAAPAPPVYVSPVAGPFGQQAVPIYTAAT
jgi:hypothetical protein